jgi:hypothetical protein
MVALVGSLVNKNSHKLQFQDIELARALTVGQLRHGVLFCCHAPAGQMKG